MFLYRALGRGGVRGITQQDRPHHMTVPVEEVIVVILMDALDRLVTAVLRLDVTHAGLNRLGLHAAQLCFSHPDLGTKLSFEIPLPNDLAALDPP